MKSEKQTLSEVSSSKISNKKLNHKNVAGVNFKATILTPENRALNSCGSTSSLCYHKELLEQQKLFVIKLSIDMDNESKVLDYPSKTYTSFSEKHHYFSFGIIKYIYIVQSGQEINCQMVSLIDNFNLKNETEILIGFPSENIDNNKTLTLKVEDNYFDIGTIKISL